MNRARLVGISSLAIAALAASGCGTAVQSSSGPSTPTTHATTRLDLASKSGGATPSAVGGAPAIFPVRPTTYVLDAPLPDLGATAVVRTMTPHLVSVRDVRRFADALGLAEAPARTPTGWAVQGPTGILSFLVSNGSVYVSYASGAPTAVGGSSGSVGTASPGSAVANGPETKPAPALPSTVPTPETTTQQPAPVDVPNAAAAKTIARGLLDHLGVLAGQQWSTTVNDSGGIAIACTVGVPCPAVPPEVFARTVTFTLVLDDMPVDGINWSVTIGEHRRVDSLGGQWATPTVVGSYPLRTTAAAFADLRHGIARYPGPQPMTATASTPTTRSGTRATAPTTPTNPTFSVHVIGVSLGVARWDAYDHAHAVVDLVPTYQFHARGDAGATYDIVVLALDPAAITFTNPVPTPAPLPAQPAPAAMPGAAVPPPTS